MQPPPPRMNYPPPPTQIAGILTAQPHAEPTYSDPVVPTARAYQALPFVHLCLILIIFHTPRFPQPMATAVRICLRSLPLSPCPPRRVTPCLIPPVNSNVFSPNECNLPSSSSCFVRVSPHSNSHSHWQIQIIKSVIWSQSIHAFS
jgi:hypothetical protein